MVFWLAALVALPHAAQEGKPVEHRFHRVHLRNGNFVDGFLAQETETRVVLRFSYGEATFPRDLVSRIEFVTIRSFPERAAKERPASDPGKVPPAAAPAEVKPAPRAPSPAAGKVGKLLADLKAAAPARKYSVAQRMFALDGEAAARLAGSLGELDDNDLPYVKMALERTADGSSVAPLVGQLRNRREDVRVTSLAILARLAPREARSELIRCLKDPSPAVRRAGLEALRAVDDPRSLKTLAGGLLDPDPKVREAATDAVRSLAERHALLRDLQWELSDLLDKSKDEGKAGVIALLAALGSREDSYRFSRLVDDESPAVRAAAVKALSGMQSEETLLGLLPREREKAPRVELARALGRMKSKKAVADLTPWLDDADREVRAAAAEALRAITGKAHAVEHGDCDCQGAKKPR